MSISQERLEEIVNIPDEAIAISDILELGDRFWENAKTSTPIFSFFLFPWIYVTHLSIFICCVGVINEIVVEPRTTL